MRFTGTNRIRQKTIQSAIVLAGCALAFGFSTPPVLGGCETLFLSPRLPVGDKPHCVAVGDLDGVNGLDLAVANHGSGDMSVLLSQGDGTLRVVHDVLGIGQPPAIDRHLTDRRILIGALIYNLLFSRVPAVILDVTQGMPAGV